GQRLITAQKIMRASSSSNSGSTLTTASAIRKACICQIDFSFCFLTCALRVSSFFVETRSLPAFARSYPRRFTFYLAHPIRSVLAFRVDSPVKPSLTGIILEELTGFLEKRGAPSYRAKQITDWIYKKRVASFDAMTDF